MHCSEIDSLFKSYDTKDMAISTIACVVGYGDMDIDFGLVCKDGEVAAVIGVGSFGFMIELGFMMMSDVCHVTSWQRFFTNLYTISSF